MSAEGLSKAKPETLSDFLTYVKNRQTLPNDIGYGERGYWSRTPYLEDFELVKGSNLTPQEQLEILRSMSGMMSVLGTAAVNEVSAYETELEEKIVKQS